MYEFDDFRFRTRVDKALDSVRRVLDTTRNPELPADVQHTYDDKYTLVNLTTNTALAATALCFTELGVSATHLKTLKEWSKTRSVTFRFSAERRCVFDRETKREVESATKHVTDTTLFGKFTDKTVTTVTEFFWKFSADWEITAYAGANSAESIVLLGRKATYEIMTPSKNTPQPIVSVDPPREVNVTWYFQQLNAEGKFAFAVDRSAAPCHTPRRNEDIDRAIQQFSEWYAFMSFVQNYFQSTLLPIQTGHGLDLNALYDTSAFIPIVPLFEKNYRQPDEKSSEVVIHAGPPSTSVCLGLVDTGKFLNEQKRSLTEAYEKLTAVFPAKGALISSLEAKVVIITVHAQLLVEAHKDAVDYVEHMLYNQLVTAIGKEVQPVDFAEYMNFHARKLFKPEYLPKGFCYAIRRPDHYPEGTLSIETNENSSGNKLPLLTTVRASVATSPMFFAINAATKISFFGQRYLHGCVLHRFSNQGTPDVSLVSRARQFSSFILLVGTILSKDEFKPTYATIIQNKDELIIPLLLETLPTPKEFADAIESLSPEQQRFCKAFRSMQLASSLFAVTIIQIKPQLEKVLNLPDDSLTKEIRLTQDLMEMFIKYQIPSDLLSFEGAPTMGVQEKLAAVKINVQAIQSMIESAKQQELKEAAEERVKLELSRAPPMEFQMAQPMRKMMTFGSASKGGGGGGGVEKSAVSRSRAIPDMTMISAPVADMMMQTSAAPQMESFAAPSAVVSQTSISSSTPTPTKIAEPAAVVPPTATSQIDSKSQPPPPPPLTSGLIPAIDYTTLPTKLDSTLSELDTDHAVRSTIIKPSTQWLKNFQKGLLSKPTTMNMGDAEQKDHKSSAFDLLDALSRSGVLSVDQAELHVVLIATHCFDKTLVETVIQDNINPIEKVERSALIVASTIHAVPPLELIRFEERARVETFTPSLLLGK